MFFRKGYRVKTFLIRIFLKDFSYVLPCYFLKYCVYINKKKLSFPYNFFKYVIKKKLLLPLSLVFIDMIYRFSDLLLSSIIAYTDRSFF